MTLIRISLAPVELFEVGLREHFEHKLTSSSTYSRNESGSLNSTFREICDFSPRIYKSLKHDGSSLIAFHGSSACFIRISSNTSWSPSIQAVREELSSRRQYHQRIIADSNNLLGEDLFSDLKQTKRAKPYHFKVNYVFSMYILKAQAQLDDDQLVAMKALAEPSILDLDDMLSASEISMPVALKTNEPKINFVLRSIEDRDLTPEAITFVTWASIVSVDYSSGASSSRTFDLLVALEIRLQMVWNRCYSFSNLADAVFVRHQFIGLNIDNFFWQLARTYDDAQGMLSATSSSRANRLFDAMIETSGIAREISRLQSKIGLLDQFVRRRNESRDSRYRKTVEVLLFFAALSQLFPLFFTLPIIVNSILGLLVILIILALGLLAIVLRKT
jgi:hypothetical protein